MSIMSLSSQSLALVLTTEQPRDRTRKINKITNHFQDGLSKKKNTIKRKLDRAWFSLLSCLLQHRARKKRRSIL